MSAFDTWVQAGGAGINLPGIINQAQVAKQNDLLLQYAPAREARAQAQENRLQNQDKRLQNVENRAETGFENLQGLRQGIGLARLLGGDAPDIQGAIDFVAKDGITENEQRVIDMLKSGDPAQIEALKTGTEGLIKDALMIGDIKQPTGATPRNPIAGVNEKGENVFFTTGAGNVPEVIQGITPPVGGADGADPKELEIQRIMSQFPVSRAEATALAYEKASIKTGPLGEYTYQNDITKEVKVINPETPRHVNVETPTTDTLYANADEGTGIWNAASRLVARTGAQVGFDPKFAEEEFKAETLMNTTMRDVQLAFGLSDKHPVAEQKIIEKYYPLIASWKKDPEVYKAEIIPLAGVLSRSIAQAESDTLDNTDPTVKQAAQTQARSMRKLLNALGIPLEKIEDVRSYAMAYEEGFWDWTYERQEEFIAMKTKEQQWLQGKLNESN